MRPPRGAPGVRSERLAAPPSRGCLRVLVCIDALGVGGKERQAVELIKGLNGHPDIDCHTICFATDDFYLDKLTAAGISVTFATRRARWDVGLFVRLYRIVEHHQPHVIHTNGLISSFYTLPLARLRGIPLVNGSIRNAFSGGGFRWRVERLLAVMSDYRVANSFAGLLSRRFSPSGSRNIVIYNGFDFSRVEPFTRNESAGRNLANGRAKTVGMVAEFNRYKDYTTFIHMARHLNTKRNDVLFLAVGGGPTLEAGKARAAGIDAIRFLGEQKNVEPIVATFDIGVLTTFGEGISNSIMEYMALGKPVVASDGGGTGELIVHGETGFLVPPRQPDALAERIDYLLDHPEIAQRMGEAGQARLRRQFSIDTMVEQTIELYERAAATARGRR